MSQQKTELSLIQITGGVVTAVVIGVVMGAIATIRTADNTAVVAARNTLDIAELKETCVPRGEVEVELKYIRESLARIEEQLN